MNDKINELLNANINLGTVAYAIAGIVVLVIVKKIFADIKALKADVKNLPTASNMKQSDLQANLERKCEIQIAQNYKQFENSLNDLNQDLILKFNAGVVEHSNSRQRVNVVVNDLKRVESSLNSHIQSMARRVTHLERTFNQPAVVSPSAAGNAFNAVCASALQNADNFCASGGLDALPIGETPVAEQTEEKKFKRGLLAFLSDDSKYSRRSFESVSKLYDEDLIDSTIEKGLVEEIDGKKDTYLCLTKKGWLALSKHTKKYGQFNPLVPTFEGSWLNIAEGKAMIDENGVIQPRKTPAFQ